jgi:hypothetical protein
VFLSARSSSWQSLGSFGVFLQLGRVIEGFSLLLERGIFQLEELASRSTCIGLHLSSSLWGRILYWREHFVVAHTYYLSGHLRIIPDRLSLVSDSCEKFQVLSACLLGLSLTKERLQVFCCLVLVFCCFITANSHVYFKLIVMVVFSIWVL